ncbi:MAG: tetratricopeptide repeat protein [Stagnimonas sp.]|nr:tetratricopeptide repeat protein [Stagnimonas sp.]
MAKKIRHLHITREAMTGLSEAAHGLRWSFGAFALDGNQRELRRGGQLIALEPKPLDLLMLLLSHPGELVTREEMIEQIWAGRIVTDNVVARCITKLRAVLDDDEQHLIRTVHGYGYRYLGPVSVERPALETAVPSAQLQAGQRPPLRANWRLVQAFGKRQLTWLARHEKTNAERVFKFALDPLGLLALKREIAVLRALSELLPNSDWYLPALDWNLEESPWFIELPYLANGSLVDWAVRQGGLAALPLAQRIELLAQAAEVIGAAHAVGMLHKDIKPANLLVRTAADGTPTIVICDFGTASIDPARLDALRITRLGLTQALAADCSDGTPAYLAPEVFAGQTQTIKSDIYALGVMLYQLAVGDLRRPLAPGWEREVDDEILREDIAAAADTDPRQRLADASLLALRLRSLDARRAERQREQERRANEIHQRARAQKTQARRRWTWALVASLACGLGISAVLYRQAVLSAREARSEAARAEEINRFLNEDLLAAADPYHAGGGSAVTVRSVLDAANATLDARLGDHLPAYTRLSLTLADAYTNLGLEDTARRRLQNSMAHLKAGSGDDEDYDSLRAALGEIAVLQGHFDEARTLSAEGFTFRREHFGADHLQTLRAASSVAWVQYELGQYAASATAYEGLRRQTATTLPEGHIFRSNIDWYLAETYIELGRYAEAERLIRGVLAQENASDARDDLRIYWLKSTLGDVQVQTGRYEEAQAIYGWMLQHAESKLGARHPMSQYARHVLGVIALREGRTQEAITLLEKTLALRIELHGEAHYDTHLTMNRLAEAYLSAHRDREAREMLEHAWKLSVAALGEAHPRALDIAQNLAWARARDGDTAAANTLLEQTLNLAETALPSASFRWAWLKLRRAQIATMQQHGNGTDAAYADARQAFTKAYGADRTETLIKLATTSRPTS